MTTGSWRGRRGRLLAVHRDYGMGEGTLPRRNTLGGRP